MKATARGRSRRARSWIAGVVGLILIRPVPIQCQPAPADQSQSLMRRATKFVDASAWVSPLYLWRDPHTVLTFRGDNNGDCVYSFALVDTRTGRSQPLEQLNTQWQKYLSTLPDRNPRRLIEQSLSPDSKWMLISTHETLPHVMMESEPDGRALLSIDAGPSRSYREDTWLSLWWRDPIWTRDSRSCIFLSEQGVLVRDMATGKTRQMPLSKCIPSSAMFAPPTYGQMQELGIDNKGRVLVACTAGGNDDALQLARLVNFDVQASSSPPNVMLVSLPKHLQLQSLCLSPDGSKLAWMFFHYQSGYVQDGKSRVWTVVDIDRADFWISRADGKELRRLGWVKPVKDKRREYREFPESVEWAPDNQHLSFVYKDGLYTIPTD